MSSGGLQITSKMDGNISKATAYQDGQRDGSKQPPYPDPDSKEAPAQLDVYLSETHRFLTEAEKAWEAKANKLEAEILQSRQVLARAEGDDPDDDRRVKTHISFNAYLVITGLIAVSEFFFNSVVMQVFGENPVATWITALGIAVAVPVAAHYVGQFFKKRESPFLMYAGIAGTMLLFVVVAVIRSLYLGNAADQLEGASVLSRLPQWQWALLFFVINMFLFLVAATVSATAPSREERACADETKLVQAWESTWTDAHAEAAQLRDFYGSLIASYRQGNVDARWAVDQSTPGYEDPSFGDLGALASMPDLESRLSGSLQTPVAATVEPEASGE